MLDYALFRENVNQYFLFAATEDLKEDIDGHRSDEGCVSENDEVEDLKEFNSRFKPFRDNVPRQRQVVTMMIHIITLSGDYYKWLKRLKTQLYEPT